MDEDMNEDVDKLVDTSVSQFTKYMKENDS
jgi:hypothetical protein